MMKPLSSTEIQGNWATLLLPIDADDSIHWEKLAHEIDTLILMKVSGIYSNGTAGEFYNLTEAEFDRVSQVLAEKCNAADMPFQIGCSQMSPKLSLERVKRVKSLHPSAIQVVLPDWSVPNLSETIDFLRVMAEAADPVGLVLYNPPHAKKVLSPLEYHEIKATGVRLVGCKVGGGDESWYAAMRTWAPDLSLFIPGHHLATGISRGAQGAYSNVACLHPRVAQKWYETILSHPEKGLALEKRIQHFMNELIVPYIRDQQCSNQAVDKLLAAVGGWADIGTRLRWPYRGIDETEVAKVRQAGQRILPEFFEPTNAI
ncbi:MAG: dihydrodipicolinate synthase family protein [Cyclobacteriaceae bacterium]